MVKIAFPFENHLKNSLENRDYLFAVKTMNFNGCYEREKETIEQEKLGFHDNFVVSCVFLYETITSNAR